MELQKEITNLQEEYTKIILEIKKLQVESKIKKENLEEKEYEFDRENNRLFNINEDIDSNIENNNKHKEKYIESSLENLEMNNCTIFSLLFTILGLIFCFIYKNNIDIFFKIGITTIFTYIGGTISLYISDLYKNKLKEKFEKEYQESIQNREYQLKLSEYKQLKEKIEKEHQIKYQIYKTSKKEYDNIINQINIKKDELHQIREKLISLVFPSNQIDEIKNLTEQDISIKDNKLDIDELEKKPKTKKKIKTDE